MNAAWQNHNTADGNADISVLARLVTIVEATRVAQQVESDLSYATSYKKIYQRYKAYG